tara:strand:- start:372 stop:1238 length:867 start_codon:yes stop_codon:yes gene_type:complete
MNAFLIALLSSAPNPSPCEPGKFGPDCSLSISTIFKGHDVYHMRSGDVTKAISKVKKELGGGSARLEGWSPSASFYEPFVRDLKPRLVVEVGVWKGKSCIFLADAMKKHIKGGTVIAVDTWLGALEFWTLRMSRGKSDPSRDLRLRHGYPHVYYEFVLNVLHSNISDYILPFPSTSRMANRFLKDANAVPDIVHIDAAHEYKDAAEDIALWHTSLRPGGLLLGDDFLKDWSGVVRASCEHAERVNKPLYYSGQKWWVFKAGGDEEKEIAFNEANGRRVTQELCSKLTS